MTEFLSLLKKSGAYKTVKADLKGDRLSHAYLILCKDKKYLKSVLRVFAKLIVCEKDDPCGECRSCRLIDQGIFPDVREYPVKGEQIVKDDIVSLIEESFLKPVEGDRKIFLLNNAESMNAVAQNKLLKTLEEPPENTVIILSATGEYSLLPTVRSRVKTITVEEFSPEELFDAIQDNFPDKDRLKTAIACGDGTVGTAETLYGDEDFLRATEFTKDLILNMQSSKDLPKFSKRLTAEKIDFSEFLSVFEITLRDMLCNLSGGKPINGELFSQVKDAVGFNVGAILYINDKIREARRRIKANANAQMLSDWFLFSVLEGKHKWSK